MNRQLTALFSALEALLVVGIGVGIPLVPLSLMWAFQYGLQIDWIVFWRASADAWLLGHGADIRFTLDPTLAASTGFATAGDAFAVTIAPLGFALITVLLGVRAGRRIGETPHRLLGHLVAIGTFGLLALGVTASSIYALAQPSVWQGAVLPTVVFALGIAVGSETSRRHNLETSQHPPAAAGATSRVIRWVDDRAPGLRTVSTIALSGGVASATLVLAVSAIAVAVLVAVSYGSIIALYEGVQSGAIGGAALTIAQLAILPNLIVWAASWFVGPGFALGTGSTVSPLGTALGPVPAVPLFGALPTAELAYGFVGLVVPILAGFLSGVILRPRLVRAGLTAPGWLIGCGVGMGIAGGVLLGALAWISFGAAGPGRLADVGPSWWLVGLWSALEFALAATIALVVSGLRSSGRTATSPAVHDKETAVVGR